MQSLYSIKQIHNKLKAVSLQYVNTFLFEQSLYNFKMRYSENVPCKLVRSDFFSGQGC
jgi:hypothetical protein